MRREGGGKQEKRGSKKVGGGGTRKGWGGGRKDRGRAYEVATVSIGGEIKDQPRCGNGSVQLQQSTISCDQSVVCNSACMYNVRSCIR